MSLVIVVADSSDMVKAIAKRRGYQIIGDILKFDTLETDNLLRGELGSQYLGSDSAGFIALASR